MQLCSLNYAVPGLKWSFTWHWGISVALWQIYSKGKKTLVSRRSILLFVCFWGPSPAPEPLFLDLFQSLVHANRILFSAEPLEHLSKHNYHTSDCLTLQLPEVVILLEMLRDSSQNLTGECDNKILIVLRECLIKSWNSRNDPTHNAGISHK